MSHLSSCFRRTRPCEWSLFIAIAAYRRVAVNPCLHCGTTSPSLHCCSGLGFLLANADINMTDNLRCCADVLPVGSERLGATAGSLCARLVKRMDIAAPDTQTTILPRTQKTTPRVSRSRSSQERDHIMHPLPRRMRSRWTTSRITTTKGEIWLDKEISADTTGRVPVLLAAIPYPAP